MKKNQIAFLGGAYSLAVTAIVLAILVAVNILVSALPTSLTHFDISATKLYSITSNTKVVAGALDTDVTVYWIVQAGKEDAVIENLLDKYESLSDHITVVKKNPDVYPTFTETYTDEIVPNNSLIVECGDKNRYISYSDIYLSDVDYTNYSYVYSFDGEGALTSAIDYVVSDELPQIYVLEGHGEAELPAEFTDQLEKENMETQTFSLLNEDQIPEEAAALLIYAPQTDISEEERDLLADYITGGGRLLVFAGPTKNGTLTNLYSLLSDYGIETADGIVVEGDRTGYAFQQPYILLPTIESSDITDSLLSENYYAIMPIAQGLRVSADSDSVTALLSTSEFSYAKAAGYDLTTYEKEDGDTDGPFAVAVSIEAAGGGKLVWFASSDFLEPTYNAYSSGANLDLGMNALSSLVGETEAVAIRSKSLSYNYLTISDSTAAMLKTVMIGVLPALFVIAGVAVQLERRSRKNG